MTVLDLTQQLPGPFATALLGSLGARVIKVEPPSGDPSRGLDPDMFERVNAGKESVVLDLKRSSGRAALQRLVAGSDVLVEGFRPGVVDRLGAGWETCRRSNPRLVYCSISGWGPAGPYAGVPVHDLNLMAWGDPAAARRSSGRIGVPWVDLGAGTTAALSIVAAWLDAGSSGQGSRLDVSMLDVALSWSGVKPPRPEPEPTYGVYETRDHREVTLAILEDSFWSRLCRALELGELAEDETLASYESRRVRAEEISARVASRIAASSLDEVLALARTYDLPITPLGPGDDPRALEHLAAAGLAGGVFRLPTRRAAVASHAPGCGEHTDVVLEEFGRLPRGGR